ncbi:MAG: ABC transporter ATP-binding protein, partial [Planctomycetota bacterium]|nr:ABC transporter ATP-binding protein [Planctomycetota bacterium]
MTENAIEARDLQKTYVDHWFSSKTYSALRGITFSVPRGQIFGLLGPNGAGKTTFVKIMLGIVSKTKGQATVMGSTAGSKLARSHIGYLPENLRMRRHHTANTALEFYGGLSGLSIATVRQRKVDLLKRVGLESWADAGIKKYSKGMLQRLGLAQSLLHDPDLLILDEPTDGLDPQARAEVREIMLQLKREGKTIFVNSHILQEVELV